MQVALKSDIKALMDLKTFQKFREVVRKYHSSNEFEFRLGKKSQKRFDTNIGLELFTKVTGALKKYNGWEKVEETDESVFYKAPDYRIIINNKTDEFVHQKKKKLETCDLEIPGPLDIRLAVSHEEECPDQECEMEREVRRLRTSFVRKQVIISCTKVKGPPKDRDSESDIEYQVEIEFVPGESDAELFNQIHKVFNVLESVRDT